jgi:hypothetical protein
MRTLIAAVIVPSFAAAGGSFVRDVQSYRATLLRLPQREYAAWAVRFDRMANAFPKAGSGSVPSSGKPEGEIRRVRRQT